VPRPQCRPAAPPPVPNHYHHAAPAQASPAAAAQPYRRHKDTVCDRAALHTLHTTQLQVLHTHSSPPPCARRHPAQDCQQVQHKVTATPRPHDKGSMQAAELCTQRGLPTNSKCPHAPFVVPQPFCRDTLTHARTHSMLTAPPTHSPPGRVVPVGKQLPPHKRAVVVERGCCCARLAEGLSVPGQVLVSESTCWQRDSMCAVLPPRRS
jgi:hypothetical protein